MQSGLTEVAIPWMYEIIEIRYNGKTETGSLRFPRFVKFRDDKDTADDLSSDTEVDENEDN
ncbi:hypothetical protein IAI36_11730, partial [Streptococcus pseudopneumoniae]|uniref:hypothetical protein n=1 Tax=Streptococcus pseudopneumoniae TaxID=257758 RepID=UPI0019D5C64F